MRGLHEQCSQVLVAALGDLAQDCAIPRRLFGTSPSQAPKSRPCLNPVPLPIAATTALDDRPDPRYGHQALTTVVLLRQRFDFGRHGCNALVKPTPVLGQISDEVTILGESAPVSELRISGSALRKGIGPDAP